jgi:hypothetical protein
LGRVNAPHALTAFEKTQAVTAFLVPCGSINSRQLFCLSQFDINSLMATVRSQPLDGNTLLETPFEAHGAMLNTQAAVNITALCA